MSIKLSRAVISSLVGLSVAIPFIARSAEYFIPLPSPGNGTQLNPVISTYGVKAMGTSTFPNLRDASGNRYVTSTNGGSSTVITPGNVFILIEQSGSNATITPVSVLSLASNTSISFSGATGTGITATFLNPVGYTTTTIQSVLNSLSAAGIATYNSSTGVFTVSNAGNWAGTWQGANSSTLTLESTQILMPRVGSPDQTKLSDFFQMYSAGKFSGGVISALSSSTFSVSAGYGTIATGTGATDPLVFINWPELATQTMTTNTVVHVGVEYNSGSPRITTSTSDTWTYQDSFPLGWVVKNGNPDSALHITNNPRSSADVPGQLIRRFHQTLPYARDELVGGLILGETGTRKITLSTGYLWDRNNRFLIPAINTSISPVSATSSFDAYYRDGSTGFTGIYSTTTWDNQNYDSGSGTLTALGTNKYANHWWYLEPDGNLVMIYGRAEYANAASAALGSIPSTLPQRLTSGSRLIARSTFKKGDSTYTSIDSTFTNTFTPSAVSNHANLSNLDYTSAGHTGFQPTIATGTTSTYIRGDLSTSTFSTDVRAQLSAGTGIGYNSSTGVITNNGVQSLTAGSNITLTSATGTPTVAVTSTPTFTTLSTTNTSTLATSAGNVGIRNSSPANLFSVNSLTVADASATVAISPNSASDKGLIIQGKASQNGNLTEWQSRTGALLSSVNSSGDFTMNQLYLSGMTPGSIPIASSSGFITQDNAGLFWDFTNRALLVGTTSNVFGFPLAVWRNQDSGATFDMQNSATTSNAVASTRTRSDVATLTNFAHASGRTLSRWGDALGGYSEILSSGGASKGLAIGTNNATPVKIGVNNTSMQVFAADGSGVTIGNSVTATSTAAAHLAVIATASSTIQIGTSALPGCLVMGDSDGSGVTYVTANNGVLSATTTKPSICK